MILHKNQTLVPPVDPPTPLPTSTGYKSYHSKPVNEADPYFSNWFNDPKSRKKLIEQSGVSTAPDDVLKTVAGLTVFDMGKLKSQQGFVGGTTNFERAYIDNLMKNNTDSTPYPVLRKAVSGMMKRVGRSRSHGLYLAGEWVNGVYKPGYSDAGKAIMVQSLKDPSKRFSHTHEVAHASGLQQLMEPFIEKTWGSKRISREDGVKASGLLEGNFDRHYVAPWEPLENYTGGFKEGFYPRIMQLRESLHLKPGDKVTKEMLENFKAPPKSSVLSGLRANWTYETIADMLNTLASRGIDAKPQNKLIDKGVVLPTDSKQKEYYV